MKKTKQIEKNAKIVNKYLDSKLKGNPKKLYDAAEHLIVNGGKRLRPYMVIKSCQILGRKKFQCHASCKCRRTGSQLYFSSR